MVRGEEEEDFFFEFRISCGELLREVVGWSVILLLLFDRAGDFDECCGIFFSGRGAKGKILLYDEYLE